MYRPFICIIITALFVIEIGAVQEQIKAKIVSIDLLFFNERIRDSWNKKVHNEDWDTLTPLPSNLDDSWITQSTKENVTLIAHALGESNTASANSLRAFERSLNRFKLLEVDLVLDLSGEIYCRHDLIPSALLKDSAPCTLEKLILQIIEVNDSWIIIDVKSDLNESFEAIFSVIKHYEALDKFIFQIYTDENFKWFNNKALDFEMNTPIVSVYKSKRSANYLLSRRKELNIQAIAVPSYKLKSLNEANLEGRIFVHPIHSCDDWDYIKAYPVSGIFVTNSFYDRSC